MSWKTVSDLYIQGKYGINQDYGLDELLRKWDISMVSQLK